MGSRRNVLGGDIGNSGYRFEYHVQLRRQYLQFRFAQFDSRQPGQVCHVSSGECHLSNLLDRWVRLILVREFLQAAADQRLGGSPAVVVGIAGSLAETTETRAGLWRPVRLTSSLQ